MTKFKRSDFEYSGGYLTYRPDWDLPARFIARFKYARKDKPGFLSFLIKNFSVEEYFSMRDVEKMAPVEILETKGYVSKTVKDLLAYSGYSPDRAGYDAYLKAQTEKWLKAHAA